MNYSPAHPKIEEIVATMPTLPGATRIRSPLQELKFLSQLETFKYCGTESEIVAGYHGTSTEKIGSIVNNSLYSPYMDDYKRNAGNKYGRGVYISETHAFAQLYSRGSMLIAAAALGECKKLQPLEALRYGNKELDSDSIICSPEIVLRGATQVLPVYVTGYTQPAISQDTIDVAAVLSEAYPNIMRCVLEHLCENLKNIDAVVENLEMFDYETPQLFR